VSGRHTKSCRALLFNSKLGGAFAGTVAVGATAICVIAAGPAHSSQKVNAISAGAVLTAPRAAAATKEPHALAEGRIPRKGITDALKGNRTWVPSAADALKLAEAQVGVTEDAAGGGTKFQKWFVSSPWAVRGVQRDGGSVSDYANANWCDMFVSWIGAQLGVKGMGADAYTRTHAQWFKDQGRWGDTPTPGAVVFFAWNGGKALGDIDHVGMVVKDNHDGTIKTVEGNTDDAVKIRTRDTSTVVGYGYPEYGSKTS
jgi:surface antigen